MRGANAAARSQRYTADEVLQAQLTMADLVRNGDPVPADVLAAAAATPGHRRAPAARK